MLREHETLESSRAALEPRGCVGMGRWNPSVRHGTRKLHKNTSLKSTMATQEPQILYKKEALESTRVGLAPKWCVKIRQCGAGAAMLHRHHIAFSNASALC